ncbi:MAG: hypothetical protein NTV46_15775 [Verrucomicrobia bacterium]|nr:hypothetical protein [Verrucomicrobiota bacterium]
MTDPPICPACGTPIAQGRGGGLCPACLLHAAMGACDSLPHPVASVVGASRKSKACGLMEAPPHQQ